MENKDDDISIEEKIRKYAYLVRSVVRKYFLIGGEQEDLIQEGMIGLCKAITTYDKNIGGRFENYAILCIDSQIKTIIKKENNKKNFSLNNSVSIELFRGEDGEELNLVTNGVSNSPESTFLSIEKCNYIKEQIVHNLTINQKKVFRLYLTGKTYGEIAEMLGSNSKHVDNVLSKIRKKLKHIK